MNLPKQTKCKRNLERLEPNNKISLIADLEKNSKSSNQSPSAQDREEMADKTASDNSEMSDNQANKQEMPVGEMDKCSSSNRINYRYHLYCLVLSFIIVHLIYRYLGFLFP